MTSELKGDLCLAQDRQALLAWMESAVAGRLVATGQDEALEPTGFAVKGGVLFLGRDAHASMDRAMPAVKLTGGD